MLDADATPDPDRGHFTHGAREQDADGHAYPAFRAYSDFVCSAVLFLV